MTILTDMDPCDEIFDTDEFVERDALTYAGKAYDMVRAGETERTVYTPEGARNMRLMLVDVKVEDFDDGHPENRSTVTIDGTTYRIYYRRRASTGKVYRLELGDIYASE